VLLSGDILISIGAANVTLHRVGDGRLPAGWQVTIMESLDRLAGLPLRRVYPGHGGPLDDPRATIADRQRRTEWRLRQTLELLREQPRAAYEVSQALYQPPVSTSSVGLSQSLGYLDALEARGQAVAEERDGLRRYRPGA
jgi:glyoxylase-like metal-dependent hydrolase (beta-lactamase superfamily II)